MTKKLSEDFRRLAGVALEETVGAKSEAKQCECKCCSEGNECCADAPMKPGQKVLTDKVKKYAKKNEAKEPKVTKQGARKGECGDGSSVARDGCGVNLRPGSGYKVDGTLLCPMCAGKRLGVPHHQIKAEAKGDKCHICGQADDGSGRPCHGVSEVDIYLLHKAKQAQAKKNASSKKTEAAEEKPGSPLVEFQKLSGTAVDAALQTHLIAKGSRSTGKMTAACGAKHVPEENLTNKGGDVTCFECRKLVRQMESAKKVPDAWRKQTTTESLDLSEFRKLLGEAEEISNPAADNNDPKEVKPSGSPGEVASGGHGKITYAADPVAFNTQLAKLLGKLKKDVGASRVQQNYKGTGSKKHIRQMWVSGIGAGRGAVDVWVDNGFVKIGGVTPGPAQDNQLKYDGKSPEDVYGWVLNRMKAWIAGSKIESVELTRMKKLAGLCENVEDMRWEDPKGVSYFEGKLSCKECGSMCSPDELNEAELCEKCAK